MPAIATESRPTLIILLLHAVTVLCLGVTLYAQQNDSMPEAIVKQTASPRTVPLRVYTRFEGRKLFARVIAGGEAYVLEGATVDLQLLQYPNPQPLQQQRIDHLLSDGSQEIEFLLEGLDSGCCRLEATLTDRHGRTMSTHIMMDKALEANEWLGNSEGVRRTIPPPYQPLRIEKHDGGFTVVCWGRQYSFDRDGLVSAVHSAEASLLSGPFQLIGRADGKELRWKCDHRQVVGAQDDQIALTQHFRSEQLSLNVHTDVDFDGMLRFDLEINAARPTRIDSLSIEIPLHQPYARYYYSFPRKAGKRKNTGLLPTDGMRLAFTPFIWLGDEQRGLCWFAESNQQWFNANADAVTEVAKEANNVVLRLHLIDVPIALLPEGDREAKMNSFGQDDDIAHQVSRLQYTFGLQATPIKQVEKDAWDYRIFNIAQGTTGFKPRLEVSESLLDKLAASGVRTAVIFEHWTDIEGYSKTIHEQQLKKIVDGCHERGMQVLLYFSFLISDLAPEWRDFGKQCVILPKGGYPIFHYLPQPEQSAWQVCLRSEWQDFVVDGITRAMEQYGVEGVYLDGTEYPFPCANTHHGCGTVRPDGSIARTYPIFAVRDAMRRIYTALKSRNPDAQINVHNSTCMTIPTLGWATAYWDGEQFTTHKNLTDEKLVGLLPLDSFRAEFMGHQWGIGAEFLCTGSPFSYSQALSFCLLHDVPVRPLRADEQMEQASAIWKLMDRFGREQAEWLPYWSNSDYVTTQADDAFCSLYRHPDNGVLAVVSNMGEHSSLVTVTLELKRLDLSKDPKVVDALTELPIKIENGRIQLDLGSLGLRLLWLK